MSHRGPATSAPRASARRRNSRSDDTRVTGLGEPAIVSTSMSSPPAGAWRTVTPSASPGSTPLRAFPSRTTTTGGARCPFPTAARTRLDEGARRSGTVAPPAVGSRSDHIRRIDEKHGVQSDRSGRFGRTEPGPRTLVALPAAARGCRCRRSDTIGLGDPLCHQRQDTMTTLKNRPSTALLVVDVQTGIVRGNHERDAVVAKSAPWSTRHDTKVSLSSGSSTLTSRPHGAAMNGRSSPN